MQMRQTLAKIWQIGSLQLLLPVLLLAQTEKSEAFKTPLLEVQNLDSAFAANHSKYRLRGTELGTISLRDAYLSPLRLTGLGFKTNLTGLHYTPKRLTEYGFGFFTGLAIDDAQKFNLFIINFTGQYSWQFPVLEQHGWKGYVGPWLQGLGNSRFTIQNVNNIVGYDIGAELGATGRLEYKFKPGRKEFILTQQLSVPLGGAYLRPLYTFFGPILGETDREVSTLQIGTWNRRFGWIYKASLDLYRPRRRRGKIITKVPYRLTYTFQYDQFSQPNRAQSAIQTISFSKILKN